MRDGKQVQVKDRIYFRGVWGTVKIAIKTSSYVWIKWDNTIPEVTADKIHRCSPLWQFMEEE